ncbi:lipocalin-like domain-containing protein [Acinetobacter boissieri]|uniref:Lipocalin-like domain-containing protein n=1 Tax=Acinetobacter boissieri TaxID=1219383 RepID=A0A1G6H2N9_9GAMM|nr:lipocalin-like domain-containing protein [Acinetobacter boissieri]SDB88532.1 Lipocalin-like domain-containing protein [Acinetobacter boissieri]
MFSFNKILSSTLMSLTCLSTHVFAAETTTPASIEGSWVLQSYKVEDQATHKFIPAMGEHPTGRVIFTADHRINFVLTGDNRNTNAKTDAEKAALLDSVIAYTGKWSIKGNQWCTDVEAAWNPKWVGTQQCREFQLNADDTLNVLTPWRQMPNWPGTTRSIITFKKDK